MSLLHYFTDPVLRAPTLGCMLMCIASSLMGVLVFLRKRSLVSETLSHASYPGVVLGIMLFSAFFPGHDNWVHIIVLASAFFASCVGLFAIQFLERKVKVKSDAALCFILSIFFGIGLVFASRLQISQPQWYKKSQLYLFGQAATMTDFHIYLYAALALFCLAFIGYFYRDLQAIHFDREFARSCKIPVSLLESFLFALLVLSIVIGIRSVGIVLMSAMLIAPAIAARQYTNRLSTMLFLSALFGLFAALFGNVLSVELSKATRLSFPTGPSIVLLAAFFAFFALIFAPKRGWLFRLLRILRFKEKCIEENILKELWKVKANTLTYHQLKENHYIYGLRLRYLLRKMKKKKWIFSSEKNFVLSERGQNRAAQIIRLHRLWEVYLAEYLGVQAERVHHNAEEMEHILTPDLERKLTRLLKDPKTDPHQQPIPRDTHV